MSNLIYVEKEGLPSQLLNQIKRIAAFQSVIQKGDVKDIVEDYGHVIVDECHHVSAFTFEQVLRKVRTRFILGLTATPSRRDDHQPIILMQGV